MALTLAQAKVGMTNPIDKLVIDLFERKSEVLSRLPFVNATPQEGGNTLAYTFSKELTPATAASRALNSEYTAQEAVTTTSTVNLAITGGSYEIDRVVAKNPVNRTTQVAFQTQKKAEAVVNLFHYNFINGDTSTDANGYDGLAKQLANTDTEVTSTLDLSAMTDDEAQELCNAFDDVIARMVRKPDLILTSSKGKIKAKEAARRIGYFSHDTNDFGRPADFYDGIEIIDMGKYYNGSALVDIVSVDSSTGKTAYYFVCLGEEELCGLSPDASKVVETHEPDFTQAGAVHKGDVEFITGIALKNTKAAAVLKGVKVQ